MDPTITYPIQERAHALVESLHMQVAHKTGPLIAEERLCAVLTIAMLRRPVWEHEGKSVHLTITGGRTIHYIPTKPRRGKIFVLLLPGFLRGKFRILDLELLVPREDKPLKAAKLFLLGHASYPAHLQFLAQVDYRAWAACAPLGICPKTYAISLQHNTCIFWQKYCSEGDLYDAIDKNQLSYADKKRIALQILHQLQILHAHGWVHLDLKPENILFLNANHDVCLSDFGLSRPMAVPLDTACGSPGYFPPEMCHVRADHPLTLSAKQDIWSFAHLLHILYHGTFLIETIVDSAAGLEPIVTHLQSSPHPINAVILNILHINPENRPTIEEIIAQIEHL